MKMKWYALSIMYCLLSHNLKAEDIQQPIYQQEFKTLAHESFQDRLLNPIVFSSSGIQNFIEQIFNRQLYGQEVLPNDFRHLLQFLSHGQKSGSKAFAKSTFKLFGNKIKSATYINAYAFSHMLKHICPLLETYIKPSPLIFFTASKKQVNTILYDSFLAEFSLFKQDPDLFFENVSEKITDQLRVEYEKDKETTHAEVQSSIHRFFDTCINKLIWSPNEHEIIWDNVKKIAQQLEYCAEKDIIADADELDDLYWSLIHRFNFFMDVASPDLPISFYEKVKHDMASNSLLLYDLEEQEDHMETKGERLMHAVLAGEAKARMRILA